MLAESSSLRAPAVAPAPSRTAGPEASVAQGLSPAPAAASVPAAASTPRPPPRQSATPPMRARVWRPAWAAVTWTGPCWTGCPRRCTSGTPASSSRHSVSCSRNSKPTWKNRWLMLSSSRSARRSRTGSSTRCRSKLTENTWSACGQMQRLGNSRSSRKSASASARRRASGSSASRRGNESGRRRRRPRGVSGKAWRPKGNRLSSAMSSAGAWCRRLSRSAASPARCAKRREGARRSRRSSPCRSITGCGRCATRRRGTRRRRSCCSGTPSRSWRPSRRPSGGGWTRPWLPRRTPSGPRGAGATPSGSGPTGTTWRASGSRRRPSRWSR
mmetsp:Transcript_109042/g.326145  ORF Transcript_109042/g.326145 Transcript_109042/m.326145 type:complete len:329 (-) Transcript_109042:492-1478(-)